MLSIFDAVGISDLDLLSGILRGISGILMISLGSAGFGLIDILQGSSPIFHLDWILNSKLMISLGLVSLLYGAFLSNVWHYLWGDMLIGIGAIGGLFIYLSKKTKLNSFLSGAIFLFAITLTSYAINEGLMRSLSLSSVFIGFCFLALAYSNTHWLERINSKNKFQVMLFQSGYFSLTFAGGILLVLGTSIELFQHYFLANKMPFNALIMTIAYCGLNSYFTGGECCLCFKTIKKLRRYVYIANTVKEMQIRHVASLS